MRSAADRTTEAPHVEIGRARDGRRGGVVTIVGARLASGGSVRDGAWVTFAGGRVTAVGSGSPRAVGEVVDVGGRVLAPGFVDVHVHGGGGGDAADGPDGIAAMLAAHRAHGTTRTVLSLVSAPIAELVDRVRSLAPIVRSDPGVLGMHLEGPFLSHEARGAHDPAALVAPTAESVAALLAASGGTLAQVTVAPELPGSLEAIRAFAAAGVRVAVGHTTADLATAGAAFDAGASLLTHAFNAMPGLDHRAPGPIGAALERPAVTLELIADGLHVHPILLAALFRLAPGRVALVTDAMAAAAADDGEYRLGGLPVSVRAGAARLPSGTLAGSTLTLDAAVRTAVAAGVPLAAAIEAATAVPARALGRSDLGVLEVGAPADAVLLDDDLRVESVWAGGSRVA